MGLRVSNHGHTYGHAHIASFETHRYATLLRMRRMGKLAPLHTPRPVGDLASPQLRFHDRHLFVIRKNATRSKIFARAGPAK